MLLERGALIDAREHADYTALHCAPVVTACLRPGCSLLHSANVNVRDEDGNTPSHYGNAEIVELMSEYGGESVKK